MVPRRRKKNAVPHSRRTQTMEDIYVMQCTHQNAFLDCDTVSACGCSCYEHGAVSVQAHRASACLSNENIHQTFTMPDNECELCAAARVCSLRSKMHSIMQFRILMRANSRCKPRASFLPSIAEQIILRTVIKATLISIVKHFVLIAPLELINMKLKTTKKVLVYGEMSTDTVFAESFNSIGRCFE